MKRTKKAAALLAAAILTFSGCAPAPSEGDPASGSAPSVSSSISQSQGESGTAAALGRLESFTAGALDGSEFTGEDIQAKDVTVVNFWSLRCRPCIAELPDLAEFEKALPDNVQLITVCLDGLGNETATQSILDQTGYEGVTLISGDGDLAAVCGNLIYTPTTVFVDGEGNLMGDEICGRRENLSETYLERVNQVLEAAGKDAVSLA